jgi:citrate synthase
LIIWIKIDETRPVADILLIILAVESAMQGLEDVVAADTVLSEVDGKAGRLIIRGRSLDELAGHARFEDVTRLLWDGFLDPVPDDLGPALGAARREVFAELADMGALPPYDAMRALTARLGDGDDLATALRLLAAPSVFTAASLRRRQGLAPIAPDASLGHASDTLRMLSGEAPSRERAEALDAYLVTVSDHGLNASTFAARVIASTGAGLVSSALGGLSALKGPLHGGAPGPVIAMLDAIATPDNARPWLEAALERGDRLMGFGHRIYRVRDPRADALKAATLRLGGAAGGRFTLADAVEAAALAVLKERKPSRPLDVNVEFYTALLLEAVGFPTDAFTCVFAMARMAGWIAHAREQALTGRLIRPKSRYLGPEPLRAA